MPSDAGSSPRDVLPPEHLRELYLLLGGYRVSQAIYVVVALGIPDLLADGPRTRDALAQATGTHADALYRVLRFLAGQGLFDELSPQQFGLTALGAGLRTDVPGSMHSTVLMHLDPSKWQPWGQLLHSIQTGETSFSVGLPRRPPTLLQISVFYPGKRQRLRIFTRHVLDVTMTGKRNAERRHRPSFLERISEVASTGARLVRTRGRERNSCVCGSAKKTRSSSQAHRCASRGKIWPLNRIIHHLQYLYPSSPAHADGA
jgi:Dimerisation domain